MDKKKRLKKEILEEVMNILFMNRMMDLIVRYGHRKEVKELVNKYFKTLKN